MIPALYAEEKNYTSYYSEGKYKESLDIINNRLEEIYLEKIETVKIPTEFISTKDQGHDVDLRLLFKKRKVKGFFIEENKDISDLHLYAGKCYNKLGKLREAINNYIQSLRYKNIEYEKDDSTFYEISQVYKKMNRFQAYINSLEAAYMLNQNNPNYSLEIGLSLYNSSHKTNAIFHLEKYIGSTNEEIDPSLYLKLGNLYEDTAKYLHTEKYYVEYLKKKPTDGYIHFALGFLAYHRTGHFELSMQSLNKALELLPEKDIIQRSRAFEIKGDIQYHQREFNDAIKAYSETIKYQEEILNKIKVLKTEISQLNDNINRIKKEILKDKIFEQYEEYEYLIEQKGKKEFVLNDLENQFKKLNAGKIRWSIADSYERIEKLENAVRYYRESIVYDYKSNHAREKIIKIKLKIKRGY